MFAYMTKRSAIGTYIIVFISGFAVMAFEIMGSRVLAPFLGSSTTIWVSIIAIILLAMSVGYYRGGILADRGTSPNQLAGFLLIAAAAMAICNLAKNQVLMSLGGFDWPLIIKATSASIILFSIPAYCLAAVFPYALRMVLQHVENSGTVAGRFYAVSTIGSVAGTFCSITLLIPFMGTTHVLWLLSALLIAAAALAGLPAIRTWLGASAVILLATSIGYAFRPMSYLDVDSAYQRIWITEGTAQGEPTRYMALNGHVNSGIWIDDPIDRQLYQYPNYFALAACAKPTFDRVLMLGAGAFSFPKLFQKHWPDASLDVVEIDPALLPLSERYFGFEAADNTRVIHKDARVFLNDNTTKYDIIYSDVFTSPLEVPFQMCTLEAYQHMHRSLTPGGLLVVNVLGKTSGERSEFLQSQLKICQQLFIDVQVLEVQEGPADGLKNLIVFASKAPMKISESHPEVDCTIWHRDQRETSVSDDTPLLTDDFAPANHLLWGS